MDSLNCYILIGRSGAGKGTQAQLLLDWLSKDNRPALYIETGKQFRDFINGQTHANRLSRQLMDRSASQPSFLAVKMWADVLIDNFTGREAVIFDGTPRTLVEAKALDTALEFFNFNRRPVIYLNVSRERSAEHLAGRGRFDDTAIGIEKRLDWFETDVQPVLDYYRREPNYRFIEIDGGQSMDRVHSDILQAL